MRFLAGGPGGEPTIVSILPIRTVLFSLLGMHEACSLRLSCQELKQAVADFPWEDMETVIRGSIALWRACFPRARAAHVGGFNNKGIYTTSAPVVDADFVHFVGLRALDINGCRQSRMQPLRTSGELRG